MASNEEKHGKTLDRRTFLRRGLVAGGALAGAGLAVRAISDATGDSPGSRAAAGPPLGPAPAPISPRQQGRPNILVILVDQLRYPQWISAGAFGMDFAPNLQALREGG